MSALEFIAATGGAQVGWAVLAFLRYALMVIGALSVLAAVLRAVLSRRYDRGPYIPVDDDELGDGVVSQYGRGISPELRQTIADREASRG